MGTDDHNQPYVSYPLKDILDRIDHKLDGLISSFNGIEARVSRLENAEEARNKARSWRGAAARWAIPTVVSVVSAVSAALAALR